MLQFHIVPRNNTLVDTVLQCVCTVSQYSVMTMEKKKEKENEIGKEGEKEEEEEVFYNYAANFICFL